MTSIGVRCPYCDSPQTITSDKTTCLCGYCGEKFSLGQLSFHKTNDFMIRTGKLRFYKGDSTTVVIPDKISVLSNTSFLDTAIIKVFIPESVVYIEDGNQSKGTFLNCHALTSIHIPGSIRYIGSFAFMNSALEEITIMEGVEYIGSFAFGGTRLKKIIIPASVRVIDEYAFSNCPDLKEVIFQGHTTIKSYAFSNCSNLQSITFSEAAECTIQNNSFHRNYELEEMIFQGEEFMLEDSIAPDSIWLKKKRKNEGRCQECGSKLKGLLIKTCPSCGIKYNSHFLEMFEISD